MKLRHDEHELTRPLKNDERVVEIASFIAVYRNFFKEGNIQHFHDYWNWAQENGMEARSRQEAENAPVLDKADKHVGMDKYVVKELNLTNEFNDFFKFIIPLLIFEAIRIGIILEAFSISFIWLFFNPVVPITKGFLFSKQSCNISRVEFGCEKSITTSAVIRSPFSTLMKLSSSINLMIDAPIFPDSPLINIFNIINL